MEQIKKRKLRIEVLLTLVVLSGLVWFIKFGSVEEAPMPSVRQTEVATIAEPRPKIVDGPKPESFETFLVPGFKEIYRDMRCADILYTTLIFPAGSDYRYSPRTAVYNTATSCEKGKTIDIFIREAELNIPDGKYYLIVADQGAEGTWYNAR